MAVSKLWPRPRWPPTPRQPLGALGRFKGQAVPGLAKGDPSAPLRVGIVGVFPARRRLPQVCRGPRKGWSCRRR